MEQRPAWADYRLILACFAALAVLAYLPAQMLPPISDDYLHVAVARKYGSLSTIGDLFQDPLYRCRAVSNWISWWLDSAFGFQPLVLNLSTLALHILNTFLVALLGYWRRVGWSVSVPAAAFFVIAEGHQEAVIWYAAMPDLNVFTFTLAGFLCWVLWLEGGKRWLYAGALVAFVGALLSKESGVAFVGLQGIAILVTGWRRWRHWMAITPFAALAGAYFLWSWAARSSHQHFNDGTFDLAAPFLLTAANSVARMFWFWGVLAAATLIAFQRRAGLLFVGIALLFSVAALLPYSFLTYMPRVPSRHTYLASAALAIVVGAAWAALVPRLRSRRWAVALAAVIVLHNCVYLWTKKQAQFAERARPTTELVELLRSTDGPVLVECFPFSKSIAMDTAIVGAETSPRRLVFRDPPGCRDYRIVPLDVTETAAKIPSSGDPGQSILRR